MKTLSINKILLTALLITASCVAQAQIKVTSDGITENIAGINVLNPRLSPTLTIKTEETTTQRHNHTEAFRSVRVVEYNITKTSKGITLKRKVLSTKTVNGEVDSSVLNIFPDVTQKLLSAYFTPRKLRYNADAQASATGTVNHFDNTTTVAVDKLTGTNNNREDKLFGITVRLENMTEQLEYFTSSPQLYIDDLKSICSKMKLTVIDNAGKEQSVDITENIKVIVQ